MLKQTSTGQLQQSPGGLHVEEKADGDDLRLLWVVVMDRQGVVWLHWELFEDEAVFPIS